MTVGERVREWRVRRRLTQLELALDAGISTRHLSFVETGRSQPGRDLLLRVLARLDVPFREQNQLLLAAGHAPAYPERSYEDPEMAPLRDALKQILTSHEPYPAIAFDRHWNLVALNAAFAPLTQVARIDPALLEPPVNLLRTGLHPDGLAPMLVNLGDWRAHFRSRLERQVTATGDAALAELLAEISAYPGPQPGPEPGEVLGPLRVRVPDGRELAFFGMFATFDTPWEVTASELAVELLFPADQATADAFTALPGAAR